MQNPAATAFDQTWGFGYSPASQLLTRTASNTAYQQHGLQVVSIGGDATGGL